MTAVLFTASACSDTSIDRLHGEASSYAAAKPETAYAFAHKYAGGYPARKLFKVPYIGQEPKYPTGCEGVSAVMLMNYFGLDIDDDTFFNKYLDTFAFTFDWRTNTYRGEDLDRYYVGDPTVSLGKGCFAPVIKTAVEKFAPPDYIAVVDQGGTVAALVDKYLKRLDVPILIWATIEMRDSFPGSEWGIKRTGGTFTFPAYMHCLVLVGYDDDEGVYYFNDPYKNSGLVSYGKDRVEKKFKELGSQALAILKKGDYSAESASVEYGKLYAVRNAATGKYLTVADGEKTDGANIMQSVYQNDPLQLFTVEKCSDDGVIIANVGTGKVLSAEGDGGAGSNVCLKPRDNLQTQVFDVTRVNGFFRISCLAGKGEALTVCGNYNGGGGDSPASEGNVYIGEASDDADYYGLWEFVEILE